VACPQETRTAHAAQVAEHGEVAFHLLNLCAIRAKCGRGPGMLQEDIERTIVHSVR